MPVYAWKGLNTAGKAVTGTKDADGPKALRQTLRKDGIFVTEHKEVLGGAAGRPGGERDAGERREGAVLQARDRSRRPARAGAPAGGRGVHAPAGDAAQGGHPAGRGAGRAGRAGRQQEARAWCWPRSARRSTRAASLADALARAPEDLPRALRQHGPLRRGRRQPRRGAAAPRRLPGRAERAARQGVGRADLPDHHDGPRRDRHGRS